MADEDENENKESLTKPESRSGLVRDGLLLGVGALLTLAVQSIGQNKASAEQIEAGRNSQAVALYSQYEGMVDEARSATRYVDGNGGDASDLLKMYRHFRQLSTLVMNDEVNSTKLAGLYQGRLVFWGKKFVEASEKLESDPAELSAENLRTMNAVGNYLLLLYDQSKATTADRRARGDALADVQRAMSAVENAMESTTEAAEGAPSGDGAQAATAE